MLGTVDNTSQFISSSMLGTVDNTGQYISCSMLGTVDNTCLYISASMVGTLNNTGQYISILRGTRNLRVIIYKHQNFPIEAGNGMSQNCLKLCVFLSYVK